jgi:hypothetical protein
MAPRGGVLVTVGYVGVVAAYTGLG